MRANLRDIAQAATASSPERALLDAAGDLTDYEVFHNFVLISPYVAEKVGSIIRPDNHLEEDRYQGKVGLVLKCGPLAFSEQVADHFTGDAIQPGDWVVYRGSDTYEMFIKDRRKVHDGLPVRLIEDTLIKMRVSDPSLIY